METINEIEDYLKTIKHPTTIKTVSKKTKIKFKKVRKYIYLFHETRIKEKHPLDKRVYLL
jgi:hypothetical protein